MELSSQRPSPPPLIASGRHFLVFLAIQAALAASQGAITQRLLSDFEPHDHKLALYILILAFEWLLVLYVWLGIRREQTSIADLIAGRWRTGRDIVRDAFLGCGGWLLWAVAAGLVIHFVWGRRELPHNVKAMLPTTPDELGLWLAVSVSAGFGEEVVYRGYLQRQLLALTQNQAWAILGQALIFAAVHLYQGAVNAAAIAVLAVMLGALAAWRRSLLPGILLHIWIDGLTGVGWYVLHRGG